MNKKQKKEIEPVELKRQIQAEMHDETKHMTPEQKRIFYKKEAETGPLGKFWKSIQPKGSKKSVGKIS